MRGVNGPCNSLEQPHNCQDLATSGAERRRPGARTRRHGKRCASRVVAGRALLCIRNPLSEVDAVDQLQRHVRYAALVADLVDSANVRVVEARNRLHLASKPLARDLAFEELGADHLQRDDTPGLLVLPTVDRAHPALSEFFEDPIGSDMVRVSQGEGRHRTVARRRAQATCDREPSPEHGSVLGVRPAEFLDAGLVFDFRPFDDGLELSSDLGRNTRSARPVGVGLRAHSHRPYGRDVPTRPQPLGATCPTGPDSCKLWRIRRARRH